MANLRIVELENKSRKGSYVYVWSPGLRGRYYKWNGEPLDIYKLHYENRYERKRGKKGNYTSIGRLKKEFAGESFGKGFSSAKRYLKKIGSRPSLESNLKKGMSSVIIPDMHTTLSKEQLDAYKQKLMEPFVLDKNLLKVICEDGNMAKFQSRLAYELILTDSKGVELARGKMFNATPDTVKNRLTKNLFKGELVTDKSPRIVYDKLNIVGFRNIQILKEGYAYSFKIIMSYRKQ